MHVLQPKHTKLSEKESQKVLAELNISYVQLPKILSSDPALPDNSKVGDLIKIERKDLNSGNINSYYRVIV